MFFIVGSARSGTTLLRLIMNAHKDVAVPPETRFIVELWEDQDEIEVEAFLRKLAHHHQFKALDLSVEDVRERLPDQARLSYRQVVDAVYRTYAELRGKTRWGDKTPRYVLHLPFLARLFPGARFVHLVRDGRNVALSYADVPFGPKTAPRAAKLWAQRVEAGSSAGRRLDPERYLEMRYEDLVEDPEETLRAMCDFLDLGFDPAMLEYDTRSQQEVLPKAQRFNPHLSERLVANARSWEESMPDTQVEMFEAVAGRTLTRLGYQRRFPEASSRARLAASLGAMGFPVGRLKASRST